MNPIIREHFNTVEEWMLQNPIVTRYKIMSNEIAPIDGKLRIRVDFIDGSQAELFEYVTVSGTNLNLSKDSFHWQDQYGVLKCRWDNAPHHPELLNAPHHKHNSDQSVTGVVKTPNIIDVLEEITSYFDTSPSITQ